MTPAEVVTTLHLELWGAGDRTALDRYVAPDARTKMTGFDGSTIETMREDVDRYLRAFTNVSTEILDAVDSGDRVVLWWQTVGTHTGPYGDMAPEPTGKRITMEGVDFYRVAADRIVEVHSFWDAAAVYRQLGLLADGL
jgi:predicted ester cyclase